MCYIRTAGLITDGKMKINQPTPLPQSHSFECNRFLNELNPVKPLSVQAVHSDPAESGSSGESLAPSPAAAPRPTHPSLRRLPARLHPARRTALGLARHLQVAAVTSCGPGCRPPRASLGPKGSPRHPPELQRTDVRSVRT